MPMNRKDMHEAILALNIKEQDVKQCRLIAVACYKFLKAKEQGSNRSLQRIFTNDHWYNATLDAEGCLTISRKFGPTICCIQFEDACEHVRQEAVS